MNGKLKFTSKLSQGSNFTFQVEVGSWKNDMSPIKQMISGSLEEFSAVEPRMSIDFKP
jgi:hypothetical protein